MVSWKAKSSKNHESLPGIHDSHSSILEVFYVSCNDMVDSVLDLEFADCRYLGLGEIGLAFPSSEFFSPPTPIPQV